MTTTEESAQAFREFWQAFPSEVKFNDLVRPCCVHTLQESRAMEVDGYNFNVISQLEMLLSHFDELEGLKERVGKLNVREATGAFDDQRVPTGEWAQEFVFVKKSTHPNSATIMLDLAARNAIDA